MTSDEQAAGDGNVRTVSAAMDVRVTAATEMEMQIAVVRAPGLTIDEKLVVTRDDEPIEPEELVGPYGGRIHRFRSEPGAVTIDYRATVTGRAEPSAVEPIDRPIFLRPSRYAPADNFFGYAAGQFDTTRSPAQLVQDVRDFVADRLYYAPGSSGVSDGAEQTLLTSRGVCRDFAQLVVVLLRALNIPARFVAVYAPGLSPMDFHAVAEALVDGEWVVVDATGLAPRQSLVRIATGRDAADTAFLDNHGGSIYLDRAKVTATVDGELPVDDGSERIRIS